MNHVHYFNYLQHQVPKHPIALCLGLARVQKLFTITLSVHIYIRVFSTPIQSSDAYSKNEANKKEYMRKLYVGQMQQLQYMPLV